MCDNLGQKITGHEHGGQTFRAAEILGCDVGDICDLSASLNPFAPDVSRVIATVTNSVRFYPDVGAATEALAAVIGVDVGRVVLTNGASQAIALLAQLFTHGQIEKHTFSLYERHLTSVSDGGDDVMVWRCNPSSPLGLLADVNAEADIWDESFYPLATGRWTRGDNSSWRIGSLTKLWACPGLRVGYVIAPTVQDAERLRELQPMWSVNTLALHTVVTLLEQSDLELWASRIAEVRERFICDLEPFGLNPVTTDVNWVLIDADKTLIGELFNRRVLVRDLSSFGFVNKARVAVPTELQRQHLLLALKDITSRCG